MRVRQVARADADGYRSELVPGLKASDDVRRLGDELAFATNRLALLATEPPGLYADVAADHDLERASALAFLIAYLGPLEDVTDPFAAIRPLREVWEAGALPDLDDVPLGPRSPHRRDRGTATLEAYRAWAARAGSQVAGFTGDPSWSPERRFDRVFERLALPGLTRDARYDLLVTLGRLSRYELRPSSLNLGENDDTITAAKRVFAIGDRSLLERRAAALAEACALPIEALDLALVNWQRGSRARAGVPDTDPDAGVRDQIERVLGA